MESSFLFLFLIMQLRIPFCKKRMNLTGHPNFSTPFPRHHLFLFARPPSINLKLCRGASRRISAKSSVYNRIVWHLLTVKRRMAEDGTVKEIDTQFYSPVAITWYGVLIIQSCLDHHFIIFGGIPETDIFPEIVNPQFFRH
uniref:Lysine-specific demethylase JMJ705 isoform X1 n=2 Tax=Rhizophora mucronata TaxID=61149 RepID=A0A2P2L4A1_RHIMU